MSPQAPIEFVSSTTVAVFLASGFVGRFLSSPSPSLVRCPFAADAYDSCTNPALSPWEGGGGGGGGVLCREAHPICAPFFSAQSSCSRVHRS